MNRIGREFRTCTIVFMLAAALPQTADWERIEGGEGTSCGLGSPFYFFGKLESQERLFVFLGGGGACWDGATCDVERGARFSYASDTIRPYQRGLLDDSNEANPFRDYSVLIIPYCTGDLNLGSRIVEYTRSEPGELPPNFSVYHLGAENVRTALAWIRERVPSPETVVVGGQSGGAPSSPWVAALLAREYRSARVVQIGDAAGGLIVPRLTGRLLQHWRADSVLVADGLIEEGEVPEVTLDDLYVGAARVADNLRISQLNSVDDPTQLSFLNLVGLNVTALSSVLAPSLSKIEASVPGFRFFLVEGDKHVFLSSPMVYQTVSEGTSLVGWIAALGAGQEVESVGRSLLTRDSVQRQ